MNEVESKHGFMFPFPRENEVESEHGLRLSFPRDFFSSLKRFCSDDQKRFNFAVQEILMAIRTPLEGYLKKAYEENPGLCGITIRFIAKTQDPTKTDE